MCGLALTPHPPPDKGTRFYPNRAQLAHFPLFQNLKQRAETDFSRTPSFRFPLLRRGNRASFRFPSRSGGNLKEGGKTVRKGDDLIFEEL